MRELMTCGKEEGSVVRFFSVLVYFVQANGTHLDATATLNDYQSCRNSSSLLLDGLLKATPGSRAFVTSTPRIGTTLPDTIFLGRPDSHVLGRLFSGE